MDEVGKFLRMLDDSYKTFGLEYEMALSTRPEGFIGEIELWDKAEAALTDALNATGKAWKENPGDGAFYGPKIDITVFDALRRKFQCATVQLDFQLPIRFNLKARERETREGGRELRALGVCIESLWGAQGTRDGGLGVCRCLLSCHQLAGHVSCSHTHVPCSHTHVPLPAPPLQYSAEQGEERPVMIHRAVLGSVERMLAILTEHYAGKWPFWLSPRQVMIVPISEGSLVREKKEGEEGGRPSSLPPAVLHCTADCRPSSPQDYAYDVQRAIRDAGFFVEVNASDNKMQKKVCVCGGGATDPSAACPSRPSGCSPWALQRRRSPTFSLPLPLLLPDCCWLAPAAADSQHPPLPADPRGPARAVELHCGGGPGGAGKPHRQHPHTRQCGARPAHPGQLDRGAQGGARHPLPDQLLRGGAEGGLDQVHLHGSVGEEGHASMLGNLFGNELGFSTEARKISCYLQNGSPI